MGLWICVNYEQNAWGYTSDKCMNILVVRNTCRIEEAFMLSLQSLANSWLYLWIHPHHRSENEKCSIYFLSLNHTKSCNAADLNNHYKCFMESFHFPAAQRNQHTFSSTSVISMGTCLDCVDVYILVWCSINFKMCQKMRYLTLLFLVWFQQQFWIVPCVNSVFSQDKLHRGCVYYVWSWAS